jgi:hypothetical protein
MWTLAFGHHEDRSPTHGYRLNELQVHGVEVLVFIYNQVLYRDELFRYAPRSITMRDRFWSRCLRSGQIVR